jgi:hypothetical protein
MCVQYTVHVYILFFEKVKSPDPLMDAKLNSKTHLQTHFLFFQPFHARLNSSSNLCPYAEVGTSDKSPIFRYLSD